MQKGVDQVSDSCDNYDYTISIKKTELVYQPAPGKPYLEAHCQESCTLMMKSMPGLPKLVQHLANNVVVFGIEVESGLTQS